MPFFTIKGIVLFEVTKLTWKGQDVNLGFVAAKSKLFASQHDVFLKQKLEHVPWQCGWPAPRDRKKFSVRYMNNYMPTK